MTALADLFERDAAEIATDRRYAKPECAPLSIVGELQQAAREARHDLGSPRKKEFGHRFRSDPGR